MVEFFDACHEFVGENPFLQHQVQLLRLPEMQRAVHELVSTGTLQIVYQRSETSVEKLIRIYEPQHADLKREIFFGVCGNYSNVFGCKFISEISENEVKVVRPPRVQRDDYKIVGDIFAGFEL